MSYQDCLACKQAGTKPRRGKRTRLICDPPVQRQTRLIFDPTVQRNGTPTIEGHSLGAGFVADLVVARGGLDVMEDYEMTREQVLVACWWAGRFGTRRAKGRFGEWAKAAGGHLWHSCFQTGEPPREELKR